MADELRKSVRRRLLDADLSLAKVVRHAGFDYARVERVLHGRVAPRVGEIEILFAAIENLAARQGSAKAEA